MKHLDQLKQPPVNSRRQMESLVHKITGLQLDEQLLLAGLDRELRAARDRYELRLRAVEHAIAAKTGAARAWAESNPAAFGRHRSLDFGHGRAGFRTAPPRLQPLAKCKWDRVLTSLHDLCWGACYIRVRDEINKEQIIADVGSGKLAEIDLRKAGAQLVREEIFFVEPKRARGQRGKTAKAA